MHRRFLLSSTLAVSLLFSADLVEAATRLNAGTTQWAAAAKQGRADMLLLGDSIVAYGNGGWSAGIAQSAKESIGLAGSGLLAAPYDLPYVWAGYTGARIWSGPPSDSVSSGVPSLSPSARHFQVGSNFSFIGTGVDPVVLDMSQPLDWHVFANGTSANAQLQATRSRRTTSPWSQTTLQTTPIQSVAQQANELSDYVFRFNGTNDPGEWQSFEFTPASRDTSLYYTKLVHPNKTGMTVSGWSYSGGITEGFRTEYYNHPRFTSAARDALYQSLVAGNSGKLNVAITFSVNDANQVTPQSFGQSIQGLVADVRRDWAAAGLPLADLSFTLVSAYQVNANGYPSSSFQRLSDFRGVLDSIAAGDSQISFIDMWEAGPTWQQAIANGYLADYVHPSAAGTRVYGDVFMSQLNPTAGDADIDGDVDFDDLLALAQSYGLPNSAWRQGDFNGLGGVDFDDLLALAQNYGANASVANSQFASDWALAQTLVPEPIAAVLPLAGLLLRRRR